MLGCVLSAVEEREEGGSVILITGLGVWLGSQPPLIRGAFPASSFI